MAQFYRKNFVERPQNFNLVLRQRGRASTILSNEFFGIQQAAELSKSINFSYELTAANNLTLPVGFSYELTGATELSKTLQFGYELEQTLQLSKSVSFSYELEQATALSKTIQSSYELQQASALAKAVTFSYELENSLQLTVTVGSSYELIASTPLSIALNSSYQLIAATELTVSFSFLYELQAANQLTVTVNSSYELIPSIALTKTILASYELETSSPLSKPVSFSYNLETAAQLSITLQSSYELLVAAPITRTFQFAYELATGELSLAIVFSYELVANPDLSRGFVFGYELSQETLSKPISFTYSILQNTLNSLLAQAPIITIAKVNAPSQIAQSPILVIAIPKRPTQLAQTPLAVVNKKRTDFALNYLHPQSPMNEIWQFKTTVNKSTQGQEQRMSVRASPRLAVKFDYVLDDDGDLATLNYLHDTMQRERVLFPLHQYGARVLSGAGSNVLTLANRGLAYAAGDNVGMQGLDGQWHVTTLTAATGTVVTLAAIPVNPANWQQASLYPMALARATGELALQLGRGENTAELEIILDTANPLNFAPYSFNVFNNLPILDLPFIISGAQFLQSELETNWRDVGTNAASPFVLTSQPETSFSLELNLKANELQKLGAILSATKGKLKPFYVPINKNIFKTCTVLNGDLIASNPMLHDLSKLNDNSLLLINKTLTIKIIDRFYNYDVQGKIIGATFKTSPAIPNDFGISFVEQLVKARLETDDIGLIHDDNYLRVSLNSRTLPNEF